MSIVFVHGTGVRLKLYRESFLAASGRAASCGINEPFVECPWGDPFGVTFDGLSVPGAVTQLELVEAEEEHAKWDWLFDEPLFELLQMAVPDASQVVAAVSPGQSQRWKADWDRIASYEPSAELLGLLKRDRLEAVWAEAASSILSSPVTRRAFEASAAELPNVAHACARALIAELHILSLERNLSPPSPALRAMLVERLKVDWGQDVLGLRTLLSKHLRYAVTRKLRRQRHRLSRLVAAPIGDVLLYQAHGYAVRAFIRDKIANSRPPVVLVAHSLGGVACFDLLAGSTPPVVAHFVTVGSQVPLLYEMDALSSLRRHDQLPSGFPPWLNIYDEDDFLSYVGHSLFADKIIDCPVSSGQPFPDSHSAYFDNDDTWNEIHRFISP